KGSSRQAIENRERLTKEDIERLQSSGQLVVDSRRRRPRYFDGRFLVADDLTRDQTYFLARQADLGKAVGAGVVHGLMVTPAPGASGNVAIIQAGHGVTVSGEMVRSEERRVGKGGGGRGWASESRTYGGGADGLESAWV